MGSGSRFVTPCPLLPLEEEDLGSRGFLVGVGVLGAGGFGHLLLLAHIIQSVVGWASCMLFAGMLALAGVAVVDHACSARRQSKGSGPGLVPLRTRPRSWGEGGVRGLPPPPTPVKFLLPHHPGPAGALGVLSGLSGAVLGCPVLLLHGCACSAIVGVGVVAAMTEL